MTLACPVCGSGATREFLRRERVPVHQNLLCATRAEATGTARATLAMQVCTACGFVFNGEFDAGKLVYGPDYDNTQDCSPVFARHLDDLVRYLVEDRGIRGQRVVEVGCGKGAFLRRLVSHPGANITGVGFDPSYVGPDSDLDGKLVFQRRFFGAEVADVKADAVVCRHVIEHVPDPVTLLKGVREALAGSDTARVFFETPCVSWILRNDVIWDFFYEHCSLFTADSLSTAFEAAGFRVDAVRHLFGGQYLWLEAVPAPAGQQARRVPGDVPAQAVRYGTTEQRVTRAWDEQIRQLAARGPVAIWGAGAKGSTFANLVDAECRLIDSVVDLNPNKQGRYIPGTGHPIVDYHALSPRGVREIILMNPNYRDENRALLKAAGIAANFVEWNQGP